MTDTFIIAEAGVNHNADLDLAYKLIDVAADAGANAVKFQASLPELVVTASAEKANYQKELTDKNETQLEMIRKITFPLDTFKQIKKHCKERKIIFFATAFDLVSLNFLNTLGQDYHKIPSGEITNLPYIRQIAQYGKPIILSTGMSTMDEIKACLEVLELGGAKRDDITILHCNTEYPTPMCDVNLRAMCSIGKTFGVAFGYSDHTTGTEVPIAAVAMGATIIEKHFTLDRTMPGPDHQASLEPDELHEMVQAIRNIEVALGDGVKCPSSSELKNKQIARKSILAAGPVKAGEVFTPDNLIAKRPGTGVSPMRWDEVIGQKAKRDFASDEMIEL